MDTLRPDERAAGVISGADPYRELELYLEKVNEEIGEVFDRWKTTDCQSPTPSPSPEPQEPAPLQPPGAGRQPPSAAIPIPSPSASRAPCSPAAKGRRARSPHEAAALCNGAAGASPPPRLHHNGHAPLPEAQPQRPRGRTRALKSRDSSSLPSRGKRGSRCADDYSLDQWSEGILAEFNSIIADELSELARQQEARKEQQQQQQQQQPQRLSNGHARRRDASPSDGDAAGSDAVAEMRLRVARSRSWDHPPPPGADSDSTPPPSPAPSPCASEASAGSLLPQRALGLARALQRPRPRGQLPTDAPRHGDAVLVRVASLPDADFLRADREPAAAQAGKPPPASPLAKSSTGGRPAKAPKGDAEGGPRQQRSRSDEHLLKNGRASPAAGGDAKGGGGAGGTLRRLLDGRSSTRERSHKRSQKVDAGVATDDGPTWPAPVPDSGDEACSPGRISVLPVALQSLLTRIRPRRGGGGGGRY